MVNCSSVTGRISIVVDCKNSFNDGQAWAPPIDVACGASGAVKQKKLYPFKKDAPNIPYKCQILIEWSDGEPPICMALKLPSTRIPGYDHVEGAKMGHDDGQELRFVPPDTMPDRIWKQMGSPRRGRAVQLCFIKTTARDGADFTADKINYYKLTVMTYSQF